MDAAYALHHARSWAGVMVLTGMLPMATAAEKVSPGQEAWLRAIEDTSARTHLPVVAQVWGPLTLGTRIHEIEALLRMAIEGDPRTDEVVAEGLERSLELAVAAMEAGAGVLWVAEPIAAILDPVLFARYAVAPLRYLAAEATGRGRDSVLHASGRVGHLLPSIRRLGFGGVSLAGGPRPLDASKALGEGTVVLAGPDSHALRATPAGTLAEEARALAEMMAGCPFVTTFGSAVPDDIRLGKLTVIAEAAGAVRRRRS